jgi:pimeloyl-ACP methyl ester carboxylesterase
MKLRLLSNLLFLALIPAVAYAQNPNLVEKEVSVYGFNLHYAEAGSGPPVIFLHGLGSNWRRWERTVEALAPDFHFLALDQIGHGDSDQPLTNYSSALLVEFLAGFMQALQIPRATLVGNSMGAGIATEMAVSHPALVERLILVDGAGYRPTNPTSPPTAAQVRLLQLLNSSTLAETRELETRLYYDDSRVTEALVAKTYTMRLKAAYTISKLVEAAVKGIGGVTEAEMRSITVPTLIIWGKEDEMAPLALAERLHKDIAGSQLAVIDHCGHMPQIEKAEEFNQLVRGFLHTGKIPAKETPRAEQQ